MIYAHLEDGREIPFPDGTDEGVIDAKVKEILKAGPPPQPQKEETSIGPYKELAQETASGFGGLLKTGAIQTGEGITAMARGVGLVDPADESEKRSMAALEAERPYTSFAGKTIGESIPSVAATALTGGAGMGVSAAFPKVANAMSKIAVAAKNSPKLMKALGLAGTVGAGATEGAIITRGRGGSPTLGGAGGGIMAGVMAAISPKLGHYADNIYAKVTGKAPNGALLTPDFKPTQELIDGMAQVGVGPGDFDDQLVKNIVGDLLPGSDPKQTARLLEFKNLDPDFPVTKSNITGKQADQIDEQRIGGSKVADGSSEVRDVWKAQAETVESKLRDVGNKAGDASLMGESTKSGLAKREEILSKREDKLYGISRNNMVNVKGLELVPYVSDFSQVLPSEDIIENMSIYAPEKVKQIRALLAKYKVDTSKEALEIAKSAGVKDKNIKPLSLDNFDTFRKALGNTMGGEDGKYAAVIAKPIIKHLDSEVDRVIKALEDGGIDEATKRFLDPLKAARKTHAQIATEFSPQSIAGRLTDSKYDNYTSVIEASKVYQSILGGNQPKEYAGRVVDSLQKAGQPGKKAMGNLQAAVVLDIIDAGLKSETRKIDGQKIISYTNVKKRIDAIGDDRLKTIFRNNPDGYRQLKKIYNVSSQLIPDSGAMQKGSAQQNFDIALSWLSKFPVVGEPLSKIAKGAQVLHKLGGDKKAIDEMLKARPDIKKTVGVLEKAAPNYLRSLGVAAAIDGEDE
jgi:hypothetical protein